MIDSDKVKAFWESRANKLGEVEWASIVNLEEDKDALLEKVRVETSTIMHILGDITDKTILDLGAGIGQWAFRFLESGARWVTAVEYAENLVRLAKIEKVHRGVSNIDFVVSPAEQFCINQKFDIIFISGLFVYMNDSQVKQLMPHLRRMVSLEGGMILLRDGTGRFHRHVINQKISEHLGTEYSAIYRTSDEYKQLFSEIELHCAHEQDMFPEGHFLNKYPETRLRVYMFE